MNGVPGGADEVAAVADATKVSDPKREATSKHQLRRKPDSLKRKMRPTTDSVLVWTMHRSVVGRRNDRAAKSVVARRVENGRSMKTAVIVNPAVSVGHAVVIVPVATKRPPAEKNAGRVGDEAAKILAATRRPLFQWTTVMSPPGKKRSPTYIFHGVLAAVVVADQAAADVPVAAVVRAVDIAAVAAEDVEAVVAAKGPDHLS